MRRADTEEGREEEGEGTKGMRGERMTSDGYEEQQQTTQCNRQRREDHCAQIGPAKAEGGCDRTIVMAFPRPPFPPHTAIELAHLMTTHEHDDLRAETSATMRPAQQRGAVRAASAWRGTGGGGRCAAGSGLSTLVMCCPCSCHIALLQVICTPLFLCECQ